MCYFAKIGISLAYKLVLYNLNAIYLCIIYTITYRDEVKFDAGASNSP